MLTKENCPTNLFRVEISYLVLYFQLIAPYNFWIFKYTEYLLSKFTDWTWNTEDLGRKKYHKYHVINIMS